MIQPVMGWHVSLSSSVFCVLTSVFHSEFSPFEFTPDCYSCMFHYDKFQRWLIIKSGEERMGFPQARRDSTDHRITMINCYTGVLCVSMVLPQTKENWHWQGNLWFSDLSTGLDWIPKWLLHSFLQLEDWTKRARSQEIRKMIFVYLL